MMQTDHHDDDSGPDYEKQFEEFENLTRKLLKVPKGEIDAQRQPAPKTA